MTPKRGRTGRKPYKRPLAAAARLARRRAAILPPNPDHAKWSAAVQAIQAQRNHPRDLPPGERLTLPRPYVQDILGRALDLLRETRAPVTIRMGADAETGEVVLAVDPGDAPAAPASAPPEPPPPAAFDAAVAATQGDFLRTSVSLPPQKNSIFSATSPTKNEIFSGQGDYNTWTDVAQNSQGPRADKKDIPQKPDFKPIDPTQWCQIIDGTVWHWDPSREGWWTSSTAVPPGQSPGVSHGTGAPAGHLYQFSQPNSAGSFDPSPQKNAGDPPAADKQGEWRRARDGLRERVGKFHSEAERLRVSQEVACEAPQGCSFPYCDCSQVEQPPAERVAERTPEGGWGWKGGAEAPDAPWVETPSDVEYGRATGPHPMADDDWETRVAMAKAQPPPVPPMVPLRSPYGPPMPPMPPMPERPPHGQRFDPSGYALVPTELHDFDLGFAEKIAAIARWASIDQWNRCQAGVEKRPPNPYPGAPDWAKPGAPDTASVIFHPSPFGGTVTNEVVNDDIARQDNRFGPMAAGMFDDVLIAHMRTVANDYDKNDRPWTATLLREAADRLKKEKP